MNSDTGRGDVWKANLVKLRRKTGYPFTECKKALDANENDVEKAETWLVEEAKRHGWTLSARLASRETREGLVGVALGDRHAAMVEVNCETDFVGRSDGFRSLVDTVAKTCLQHAQTSDTTSTSLLDGEQIGRLEAEDHQSLQDHVMRVVAVVGEKLLLRRAALVRAGPDSRLAALTHPTDADGGALRGRYGTVLLYHPETQTPRDLAQLTRQLCQHIIGLGPKTLDDSSEDSLLQQKFLLDPSRTVADVAKEAGIKIEYFVRFECGDVVDDGA